MAAEAYDEDNDVYEPPVLPPTPLPAVAVVAAAASFIEFELELELEVDEERRDDDADDVDVDAVCVPLQRVSTRISLALARCNVCSTKAKWFIANILKITVSSVLGIKIDNAYRLSCRLGRPTACCGLRSPSSRLFS